MTAMATTSGRLASRPWAAFEDSELRQAVAVHGENDNWKTIALTVPGRTNKACRKRWLHSLSPYVKKSAWTPTEDARLLALHSAHGPRWSLIARAIPGRTDDACAKRYREALDPVLRKDEWTEEEDVRLLACVGSGGGGGGVKWGMVGAELRRSGLGCRNRWRLLERKRLSALSSQLAVYHDTESTGLYREDSPPPQPVPGIDWPALSMLDVTRYWPSSGEDNVAYASSSGSRAQGLGEGPSAQAFAYSGNGIYDLDLYAPHYQHASYSALSAVRESQSQSHILSSSGVRANDSQYPYHATSPRSRVLDVRDHGVHLPIMNLDVDDGLYEDTTPEDMDVHDRDVPGMAERATVEHDDRRHHYAVATPSTVEHSITTHDDLPPPRTDISEPLDIDPAQPVSLSETPTTPPRKSSARKRRPAESLRLSGDLLLTSSPDILPYACGHRLCWPPDATESTNCYSTSRALNDHSKQQHAGDLLGGGAPFRCGLDGCGKAWRSVNGLQYHLQVSKAHFQKAVESMALIPGAGVMVKGSKKVHPCPHPRCPNRYKQLSGLRYHLSHGHPDPQDLPAQLDVVPPALVRRIAEKALANQDSD